MSYRAKCRRKRELGAYPYGSQAKRVSVIDWRAQCQREWETGRAQGLAALAAWVPRGAPTDGFFGLERVS